MGGVMLIGIVVNNAILIVDQFNIHVREGATRHRAMINATCERFRPIIMITLAAVPGMLPLAIGKGIDAEIRNATDIGSASGILVSGILTLIVLPTLYDLFTRRQSSINNKRHLSQPDPCKDLDPGVLHGGLEYRGPTQILGIGTECTHGL